MRISVAIWVETSRYSSVGIARLGFILPGARVRGRSTAAVPVILLDWNLRIRKRPNTSEGAFPRIALVLLPRGGARMTHAISDLANRSTTRSVGPSMAVLCLCWTLAPSAVEAQFVHPGLLHTRADLERMRAGVANKTPPIYAGFRKLEESPHAKADYRVRGPAPEWGRRPNVRSGDAQSDATAAYQNALMWAITGKREHARKAIEIVDAWSKTLQRVTGIDGVLASGLQGVKFANAAELLRYTDSGWPESSAERCERWFLEAWHPKIEHYAYFANGNWETAALQTKMAIAIYCDDRELFEETVRYALNGCGNGSIPHTVVYPTGQCQETTRAQHYAQLGLGLLVNAAEMAWNQGVDLYGAWDDRILRGFEYIAQYGLGEDVPYQHYLDRTGKYGLGGRHQDYDKISTTSRGSFWPIFERPLNHYVGRRGLDAPYSTRVVQRIRPEGFSADHVGLGTLTNWRPPFEARAAERAPGAPAGLLARSIDGAVRLTWARSVEPIRWVDAASYNVERSKASGGPYAVVATGVPEPVYVDRDVTPGALYHYVVTAVNDRGASARSVELAANAGLPAPWSSRDIGTVGVSGFAEFDGDVFSIEGEGRDIGGTDDSFPFRVRADARRGHDHSAHRAAHELAMVQARRHDARDVGERLATRVGASPADTVEWRVGLAQRDRRANDGGGHSGDRGTLGREREPIAEAVLGEAHSVPRHVHGVSVERRQRVAAHRFGRHSDVEDVLRGAHGMLAARERHDDGDVRSSEHSYVPHDAREDDHRSATRAALGTLARAPREVQRARGGGKRRFGVHRRLDHSLVGEGRPSRVGRVLRTSSRGQLGDQRRSNRARLVATRERQTSMASRPSSPS